MMASYRFYIFKVNLSHSISPFYLLFLIKYYLFIFPNYLIHSLKLFLGLLLLSSFLPQFFDLFLIYILVYLNNIHWRILIFAESAHKIAKREHRSQFPTIKTAAYLIVEPVMLLLIFCVGVIVEFIHVGAVTPTVVRLLLELIS